MKPLRNILIVGDSSDPIRRIAERLADSLKGLRVSSIEAAQFSATDLLPADAYFFGCLKPNPSDFAELERVLGGINLAGRPCGLFSHGSAPAVEYLRRIVRDAEFQLNPEPWISDSNDAKALAAWVQSTLNRK